MRNRLRRLREQVAVREFSNPELQIPGTIKVPPDTYDGAQLLPRARHELEEDRYSNFLQFQVSVHILSNADGSRQVLAQNKRRQYLMVQSMSADANAFINFGNDASALQGIALGFATSAALPQRIEYHEKVPNNSLHLFMNSATPTQIIVVEGSPEP